MAFKLASLALLSLLVLVVQAFNRDFVEGLKVGHDLETEHQFEVFNCPEPILGVKTKKFIEMSEKVIGMSGSVPLPDLGSAFQKFLENHSEILHSFASVLTFIREEYEGGGLCGGMLSHKRVKKAIKLMQ